LQTWPLAKTLILRFAKWFGDAGGRLGTDVLAKRKPFTPPLQIRYDNLSLVCSKDTCKGRQQTADPDVPHYLLSLLTAPARWLKPPEQPHGAVLKNISGVLRPGTATIIMAAAGGGSSTFLRLLAGRQQCTAGTLQWGGRTSQQLAAEGVVLRKLVAYCPEADDHEFLLTVAETFDFAHSAAVVPAPPAPASAVPAAPATAVVNSPGALDPQHVSAGPPNTAPDRPAAGDQPPGQHTDQMWTPPDGPAMVGIMGLTEARDTIVGNALVRGISGGQKRRVTLGETLLLNARVLALDGPTNGLDAVTAHEVMRYAVDWAHATSGTLVATLQQPLPETFALFDDVILLSEGRVLYHGPVARMDEYCSSLGFVRPSYMDPAAWAVELVSSPANAAVMSLEDCSRELAAGAGPDSGATAAAAGVASTSPPHRPLPGKAVCAARIPELLTVDALAEHWTSGAWAAAMMAGVPLPPPANHEATAGKVAPPPVGAAPSPIHVAAAGGGGPASGASEALVASGEPGLQHGPIPPAATAVPVESCGSDLQPLLATAYARAQYGSLYTTGFWAQVRLTTAREMTLARRNWLYSGARLVNAVLMGAILGTVFIQLDPQAEFFLFFSVSLFAVTFVSFLNNAIIPIAGASRLVVYKHTGAGLFRLVSCRRLGGEGRSIESAAAVLCADCARAQPTYSPATAPPPPPPFASLASLAAASTATTSPS